MLQWFHSSKFTVVVQINQHNCNYHQSIYVTVATLCILRHSYKHMCRMWCMSWHLSTTISPLTARGAVLLAATFDELATRSWSIREHCPFWFPSIVCFVQHQSSRLGSLIWGHMDWPLTWPPWHTARLIYSSSATFCRRQVFVRASFLVRMFPSMWSSFLTQLMFPSLVVLSYKSTENIYVTASFYAQLSMYQCWLTVQWITMLSSDTLSIFRYTIQTAHGVLFDLSLQCQTTYRILWMNETSEALLVLLILILGWSHELQDIKLSFLCQGLSITPEHPNFPRKQLPGPEYLYLPFWWVACGFPF